MDVLSVDVLCNKPEEDATAFLARFELLTAEDRRQMLHETDSSDDGDDEGRVVDTAGAAPGSWCKAGADFVEEEEVIAIDGSDSSPSGGASALGSIFSSAAGDVELSERRSLVKFDNFLDIDEGDECQVMTTEKSRSQPASQPPGATLATEGGPPLTRWNEDQDDVLELPGYGSVADGTPVPATRQSLHSVVEECDDSVAAFALDPEFDYDAVAAGITRKFRPCPSSIPGAEEYRVVTLPSEYSEDP